MRLCENWMEALLSVGKHCDSPQCQWHQAQGSCSPAARFQILSWKKKVVKQPMDLPLIVIQAQGSHSPAACFQSLSWKKKVVKQPMDLPLIVIQAQGSRSPAAFFQILSWKKKVVKQPMDLPLIVITSWIPPAAASPPPPVAPLEEVPWDGLDWSALSASVCRFGVLSAEPDVTETSRPVWNDGGCSGTSSEHWTGRENPCTHM